MLFLKGSGLFEQTWKHGPATVVGLSHFLDFAEQLKHTPLKRPILWVLPSEEDYDLFARSYKGKFVGLKGFSKNPYAELSPHSGLSAMRLSFLHQLRQGTPQLFVSYPEALAYCTLPQSELIKHTLTFTLGQKFFPNPTETLLKLGYTPSQFVEKPGQFSNKGGLVDVFSPAHTTPIRIELFGEEIESLREFLPQNQRSLSKVESFTLIPAHEALYTEENSAALISSVSKFSGTGNWKQNVLYKIRNQTPFEGREFLLPLFWNKKTSALSHIDFSKTQIFISEPSTAQTLWQRHLKNLEQEHESLSSDLSQLHLKPYELYPQEFKLNSATELCAVQVSELDQLESSKTVFSYKTHHLKATLDQAKKTGTSWEKFIGSLDELFQSWLTTNNKVILGCSSEHTLKQAQKHFEEMGLSYSVVKEENSIEAPGLYLIQKPYSASVRFNEDKVVLLRFRDVFHKSTRSNAASEPHDFFEQLELLQMADLSQGDLVVHADHGVGSFEGLKVLNLNGVATECLELHYKGTDKLFLPAYKLNLVRKYSGTKATRSLDKLGGSHWNSTKAKVKSKLKEIANDLVELYAKRKAVQRPPLAVENSDNFLFQNQFPFEETPGQLKAIDDIYGDFKKDHPMDRIVCGDVGFGKTEVAMRAVFVALAAGKQVAVLAPTTVLTLQHFNSFCKRFKNWPFEIRVLNRFVSPTQVRETLQGLKAGTIDLVIGTHRLLSSDVKFFKLGLLVVDEEQKFGVKQKEKIKAFKNNVDILSLSATPIPRTLNMGFLGVRDLSLISTPPKDRLPIKTYVSHYSSQVIAQAVDMEIKRGGQIYFIHNRVQSIYGLYEELKLLLPHVRIGLGHGQMNEHELEKIMLQFFNKEIDMLLSTTIVESGMDLSNANTMIINNAQNFGLSQLYQLRGRVGRSEKRAFCYLMIPKNRDLEKDQKTKLKVLQDHTELGSGIQISHHDLEIRGAGNLLGEAQSGHAEEIGYELYIELLEEAMAEIKGEDLGQKHFDTEINIPLPAMIPGDYIKDFKTRLYYYKKINKIKTETDLDTIESELVDQFGKIPEEIFGLFFIAAIKLICKELGVVDIKSGPKNLALRFSEKPKISIDKLLELMRTQPQKYKLSPDQRLVFPFSELTWPNLHKEFQRLQKELL